MRKPALLLAAMSIIVLAAQPASAISLGGIRNSLVQWVLEKVSIEDVFEIEVEEVVGAEEEGTTLLGVTISDAQGIWFQADQLTFDFNRTRLLRGQLFIDNLELEGVEMFRQPVVPAGEAVEVDLEGVEAPPDPETPFYWPRSPITTAIQRLALEDIYLHEEVLGQAIRFDAMGSFLDRDAVQEAELELRRTDEVEGVIDFDYSRNFDENTLAVNLEASEAAGGLVSELAGLPADVPVKVSLEAAGTPEAFKSTFDLALTDYLQAEGTATVDYAGPLGIDAQFVARPGPLFPEEYAQILGEQAELVVQASEGPDQTVEIETARIVSPYLRATLDGTYARDTGAVNAEVELVADPELAAPFEGIEFAGLRFEGNVQGTPGSYAADGDLVLQGLVTPQLGVDSATLEIDVAQSGPADSPVTELTAAGLVDGLRLDQVGPEVIGDARIRLGASLEGEDVRLDTLAIESQPLNVTAEGTANITTGDFSIDYDLAAPQLEPILDAYGIAGSGQIAASGQAASEAGVITLTTNAALTEFESDFAAAETLALEGTVVQTPERTTFDLTGTGEELGIGQLGPDILDRADLAVSGVLEGETLTLQTARLDSPVLDVIAEGQVGTAGDVGQIEFSAASDNLTPLAEAYGYDLQGAFEAAGTLALTPEGAAVDVDATLSGLAGDIEAERLSLNAAVDQTGEITSFTVAAESPSLAVELEGEELSGPVDLAVEGALAGDELTLQTARVESPILDATIDGRLNLAELTGLIAYDIDEARLAALAPLLGVEASGVLTAQGTADLGSEGPGAAHSVEGTAAVADLSAMGTFIGDLAATYDLALPALPEGDLRLVLTESPFAPEGPTVLTLDLGGPAEGWTAEFDLSAPNYLQAGGTATVSLEDQLSVSADIYARPGPALPDEYAQLIGEQAELIIEAAEGEDGTLVIDTARLSSPVLNAQVAGTYNLDTGAAALEVELAAEPALAAPFEGIDFAGLRFEGEVTGAPGDLRADGDLVLDGFVSDQLAVDAAALEIDVSQTGTAEAPVTDIDLKGTVDGLRAAGLGPETIGQARIALDATLTGDELAIEEARIDSDLLQLWASGTANIATMEFDLDYDIAARQLSPLAQALGVEAAGAVTATGTVASDADGLAVDTRAEFTDLRSPYANAERLALQGQVSQEGDRLTFDVTGDAGALQIDALGPEPLGDADFAAKGVLDGQELALDTLRIDSPLLQATADGTVDLETGEGRLAYDIDEAALGAIGPLLDVPVTGTASAQGVLGLAPAGADAPRIVGEATVEDLAYAGTEIGDAVLTHDVLLSENPSGTLELALNDGPYAPAAIETAFRLEGQRLVLDDLNARGFGLAAEGDLAVNLDTLAAEGGLQVRATEGPFAPAEAQAQILFQGDRLVLDDLRAQAFGLAAAGDIAVNIDTLLAEGTLRIDDADLAALGELLGAPVAGEAEGTVRLSAVRGEQVVALDLALVGFTGYNVAIGAARVEGTVVDVLGTPRLDLDMTAERIVSDDLRLETATLTADGPLSDIDIALRGAGELDGAPLALMAAARADLAGPVTRATLAELEVAIGEDRIALLDPMTIVSRGSAIELGAIALALPDGGRLTGDVAYYGGPVAGAIMLDAPDISFLERMFDLPVEGGAVRLAGTFDTRRGTAGADLTVTARELVIADIAGAALLSIDAGIDWNGTILDLDLIATGDFDEPLVVTALLPVRATDSFPELAESGPVSAQIEWQGEIGDIWALVPLPGHILTGDANIDLGVSGDISSPVFTGGILLADGVYQNLDYGMILTGLSLATTVESTGALALRLEGVDGAQGNVRLEGRVGFDEQGIDLVLETRRAVVIRRDDAIVRADTDMRIYQQPGGALVIAGTIEILEAEIRLVLDNPPEIVTLGDVRIKGEPVVDVDDGVAFPIVLQIQVVGAGDIFVRGRGLNSEWGIDLEIGGTGSEPRITGEVAALRGELDLLGREFELERGRVLFNGGPTIDPRLDVSLVRETDDITGRIQITGSAFDPELSLSSTPALPEDEVLPRLLFGTSAQALSPAQGLQLALGIATLLNGNAGALDSFRAALGLDALGIEQDEEGAVLEVGKNITDSVWVGTRQSLQGGGTEVAVEIEVFDNVDAYGEVNTGGETAVGVQWKKDF